MGGSSSKRSMGTKNASGIGGSLEDTHSPGGGGMDTQSKSQGSKMVNQEIKDSKFSALDYAGK